MQLNRQANMMADFCYTNPTIVPGELLSRRGFSMYSGSDNLNDDFGTKKDYQYGTYHEARSKFWQKAISLKWNFIERISLRNISHVAIS